MLLLLLIETYEKDRTMKLVSPNTYGMKTWGDCSSQRGIDNKNGKWYFEFWESGNECIEDYKEEVEINVFLQTTNLDDVLAYVLKHNPKELQDILLEAKKIFNDYIDFQSWFLREE